MFHSLNNVKIFTNLSSSLLQYKITQSNVLEKTMNLMKLNPAEIYGTNSVSVNVVVSELYAPMW
jgi:hypothetical protein